MEGEGLSREEEDHLLVGSILPDIHLSGLIEYHKTHTNGKEFFESLANKMHKVTALGIILHAEKPFGIDHYTHKYDGFITKNSVDVKKIAEKYHEQIGKIDTLSIHFLIEYTIDHILAKRHPEVVMKLTRAMKNPRVVRSVTAFASFHEMSERKNRKLLSLLKSKSLLKFFANFSTPGGTAQNWLNAKFYRDLKDERALPIKDKLRRLTKFSFYNLKNKIASDEKLSQLIMELERLLEPRALKFLDMVTEKVTPIKNDFWSQIVLSDQVIIKRVSY